MKKNFTISALLCFALFSCQKSDTTSDRLSLNDAKELISHWVFNVYNPDMNPAITIYVNEITSEEIWNKFHAQIFTTTAKGEGGSDITELNNRRFFIKNRKICDLCRNWTWDSDTTNKMVVSDIYEHNLNRFYVADTLNNLVVTDLDNDNMYEICFSLNSGSGKIRSHLLCYIYDLNDYILADTSFLLTSYKITKMVRENYQTTFVYQVEDVYTATPKEYRIGEIKLIDRDGSKTLEFVQFPVQ